MTVPAVVLLGGLARRMGGGDKTLLLVGGRTILARTLACLAPQADPIALNVNGNPKRFTSFGLPILPDYLPGNPGPLAGILAGMDWAAGLGADAVLSVPGDCPFLPGDLVPRLAAARGDGVAMAASRPRAHPVVGLWPTRLRDDLRAAVDAGERRVGEYAARHGAVAVPWPTDPYDPFLNVNTPQDLAEAGRLLVSPCGTAPAAAGRRKRPPG